MCRCYMQRKNRHQFQFSPFSERPRIASKMGVGLRKGWSLFHSIVSGLFRSFCTKWLQERLAKWASWFDHDRSTATFNFIKKINDAAPIMFHHQHDFDESGLTYWIGTNAKMALGQSGPVRIGRRDFVGRPELSVRQIEGHPQPRRVGLTTLAATAGRCFATCSSKFQRMVFIRRRCILQSSVLASDRIT